MRTCRKHMGKHIAWESTLQVVVALVCCYVACASKPYAVRATEVVAEANSEGWRNRHMPRNFGLPVVIGNTMYLNFTHTGGTPRLIEAMKLPKRFSEKPRKQDVYSKRDWENHPSHAPPYGFGSFSPSSSDTQYPTSTSTTRPPPQGKQEKRREHATAFIPAFTGGVTHYMGGGIPFHYSAVNKCVLNRNAHESFLECHAHDSRGVSAAFPRVGCSRMHSSWGMLPSRLGQQSAVLRGAHLASQESRGGGESGQKRGHRVVVQAARKGGDIVGGDGYKGFGAPKGEDKKEVKSGFSRAKEENPQLFPQMQAVFTCNKCETRQAKIFSRLAYEKGVVIVKCVGCAAQHIMADNFGYFEDMTGRKAVNVEDFLRAKGEIVDNRLSKQGVSELKLAATFERPDGTIEVRPESP